MINIIVVIKKENEELKEEIDSLNFKLKLSLEKERLSESNLKSFKDIQTVYEAKLFDNKREYKAKEESLRKKYDLFEENLNKKIKDQETEYSDKIHKLNLSIKENQKIINKKDEEVWSLKDKIKNSELFFSQKEQEFIDLINLKDKKLKELQICIKNISEEAKSQMSNLTSVIEEYEKKIEEMKINELRLLEELNDVKSEIHFSNNKKMFEKSKDPSANKQIVFSSNTDRELMSSLNPNKSRDSINYHEVR